jgi:hypothetical protein
LSYFAYDARQAGRAAGLARGLATRPRPGGWAGEGARVAREWECTSDRASERERKEEEASELRQWRATAAGSAWNSRECSGGERVAHMHRRGGEGPEGREGSEGMGVNERSNKRASEEGSSLLAGSVRNATEGPGGEWRATCTPQALPSNPRTLFFASLSMKSLPFYMVSDEVEKVCMDC